MAENRFCHRRYALVGEKPVLPHAAFSDWQKTSSGPPSCLISLETLARLSRHVLVDCVELLAPLSFRLLDRFESCVADVIIVHIVGCVEMTKQYNLNHVT